jgi:putative FmdB family regulatory protein
MPLYEYECEACQKRFEKIQKYSDAPPDVCPHCGKGPIKKLFSSPAIQFKGSGFYITDYAKKSTSEAGSKSSSEGSSSSSESKSSESKSESKSSESKSSESKSDSKPSGGDSSSKKD